MTAVENDPYIADIYQRLYPNDTVIVADAHAYLLENFKSFDFIWSSPPCPTHSRQRLQLQGRGLYCYPSMALYEEVIFLKHFCKVDWVVENVTPYYKPLIEPTAVVDRHFVWSNKSIVSREYMRDYNVNRATKETLAKHMGIVLPLETKNQRKLLRNAVMPSAGLYIFSEVASQVNTMREI